MIWLLCARDLHKLQSLAATLWLSKEPSAFLPCKPAMLLPTWLVQFCQTCLAATLSFSAVGKITPRQRCIMTGLHD